MTPAFLALSLSLTSSVLAYSMLSQAELEVHALKLAERDVDSAVVSSFRRASPAEGNPSFDSDRTCDMSSHSSGDMHSSCSAQTTHRVRWDKRMDPPRPPRKFQWESPDQSRRAQQEERLQRSQRARQGSAVGLQGALGDTIPVLPGTSSRDVGHASSQHYPAQGHYRTDPPPPPNQRLFTPSHQRHYRTSPAVPAGGAAYPPAQSNQDRLRVQPPPPPAGGPARPPAQRNYGNPDASQGHQHMPSTGDAAPSPVQYSSGGSGNNRQSHGSSSSQLVPAPAHPHAPAGRTQRQHSHTTAPPPRAAF